MSIAGPMCEYRARPEKKQTTKMTAGFICSKCNRYIDVAKEPDHPGQVHGEYPPELTFLVPKWERGYPVSKIEDYWTNPAEKERIQQNVKRNSTRPVESLNKRIERML